ncbi:MAG TPA: DUF6644 family protein [Steroidobacteraceae bacterium]|nr:DUF6644 family protein [Steroidobacteraceae bacterium]
MNLNGLLQQLQSSHVAAAISGTVGWEWWFANIETIHVLAVALLFASVLMVDLRLLGLATRRTAMTRLANEALPYTWVAFAIATVTGALLFVSKATVYAYNLQFQLKMLFMLLAGVNMAIFHLGVYRNVRAWNDLLPPPLPARLAGACSIGLWVTVIFMGRWMGFTVQ